MVKRHLRICTPAATLLMLGMFVLHCSSEKTSVTRTDFPDILNVKNVPAAAEDWSAFCFSDLGAWFGFALPSPADTAFYGGFPGPFLMTHGRWMSQSLMRLVLFDLSSKRDIKLSASRAQLTAFPGLLRQTLVVDSLSIDMQLCFVSSTSALLQTSITNLANAPRRLQAGWQGETILDDVSLASAAGSLVIDFSDRQMHGLITFSPKDEVRSKIGAQGESYETILAPFDLKPNDSRSIAEALSFYVSEKERETEHERLSEVLASPSAELTQNEQRWNGYLHRVLDTDSPWAEDEAYQRVAVKALLTLVNNWKRGIGALRHDGLFPSYAIHYFNGFWAWDSWKHAVALARIEPDLAKNQIRTMFDYQDEFGMIADVIYADSTQNNWRDTKPPLAGWAIWAVYEATKDESFLREIYPKLTKYHRWWSKYRDHDSNGVCEYGSTDGTLIAAKWESGMDNAVRFDDANMVQNGERAWSMNRESVDLNSYLYAEKGFLARIAEVLGESEAASQWHSEAEELGDTIRRTMFDDESGYFYDIALDSKTPLKVQGPEGWITLWAGAASKEQAERVVEVMTDTSKFATFVPFPTVARDHPQFSNGYWRGPVWVDQAYFAIAGLRRYGFSKEADSFTRQIFDHAEGLKDSDAPIRENYDPLTGKGLNVNHFSWSAAHLLMLFWGATL